MRLLRTISAKGRAAYQSGVQAGRSERLKKQDFKESKASISNKLARSTLTAAFFLACLAAPESEGVALEDI